MTGSGCPHYSRRTGIITIALSTLNGQYNTEYNVLMAGSLISMIPIIIIYLFAQKHFKNGLMAGGIKG